MMGLAPLASLRSTIPEYEFAGTVVDANDTNLSIGDEIVVHLTVPLAHKTETEGVVA